VYIRVHIKYNQFKSNLIIIQIIKFRKIKLVLRKVPILAQFNSYIINFILNVQILVGATL